MSRNRVTPALVLCSSARRTRETLDGVGAALGPAEVLIERDLYGASSEDLLERLREVPDETESVLLVGHQPAIQQLALRLAVEGPDVGALRGKFPTAALATLTFEGDWSELGEHTAELAAYVKPKQLKGSA